MGGGTPTVIEIELPVEEFQRCKDALEEASFFQMRDGPRRVFEETESSLHAKAGTVEHSVATVVGREPPGYKKLWEYAAAAEKRGKVVKKIQGGPRMPPKGE